MTRNVCKGCGRSVRWALTAPAGRRMPLDPRPHPAGSFQYVVTEWGWRVRYITPGTAGTPDQRWMPHAATCPQLSGARSRRAAS